MFFAKGDEIFAPDLSVALAPDNKSFTLNKSGLSAGEYRIFYTIYCRELNGDPGQPGNAINSEIITFELENAETFNPPTNLTDPEIIGVNHPIPGGDDGEIEIKGS